MSGMSLMTHESRQCSSSQCVQQSERLLRGVPDSKLRNDMPGCGLSHQRQEVSARMCRANFECSLSVIYQMFRRTSPMYETFQMKGSRPGWMLLFCRSMATKKELDGMFVRMGFGCW